MSKIKINQNVLILHLTILIWGFTGILGNLISISAIHLVWYRVLIAAISLFIYLVVSKQQILVSRKDFISFIMVGGVVGLHWVLFFYAIKVSTVSVALVTLSSLTLYTSILEPLINRKKIAMMDMIVGVVIIMGIYMIFQFESNYIEGIVAGLACAFCASIFSIANARMVKKSSATLITFYEMLGAFFWVSVFMLFSGDFNEKMVLNQSDLIYLLILGVLCTAVAYVLGVAVMKELSAFTVALTTNLEPVYGILLAMLIFGQKETMSLGFYGGAAIVLGAVFFYPYLKTKIEKRKQDLVIRKIY
ncbi:permease [Sphingobacterium faecium NBRC 15299]|jgi:drug/metabolite transporter (DMT)-like permease|uniref:DMT family transporter n=1 Tax=Sphingobacterium faecium TaxID=34087 RepID=UPI000D362873|nr:EamA family transporter [Sphingobacterium faecium]MQP27532.1 EamA family transporter [Sphingobacterium faecium]PTX09151.1 EamA domain-containing membrane protein RarD [Sphingobacterium faecium]GEM65255.1 permease [Sphingobacterium faecium NBRC 15299]